MGADLGLSCFYKDTKQRVNNEGIDLPFFEEYADETFGRQLLAGFKLNPDALDFVFNANGMLYEEPPDELEEEWQMLTAEERKEAREKYAKELAKTAIYYEPTPIIELVDELIDSFPADQDYLLELKNLLLKCKANQWVVQAEWC